MENFISKVQFTNTCWLWQACGRGNGYGCTKVNGKVVDAHRRSYQLFIDDIPQGMLVCHTCDNRRCVNPDHLFLGTHAANTADAMSKGRHVVPKVRVYGERHGFAKLKNKDIVSIQKLYNSGLDQTTIARQYQVHKTTISRIVKHQSWIGIAE
jgi:hypothetical protein